MHIQSNWEEIYISQHKAYVKDSTVYFDDVDNPTKTSRDRKNMRVKEDSLYEDTSDE